MGLPIDACIGSPAGSVSGSRARAIVVEPQVLLLDEPLGALDLNLRRQMQDELVSLQRRLELTFVHVTHNQDEANSIADVIALMKDGRIEDMGAPDRIYLRPATRFTAAFMGDSNVVPARIGRASQGWARVETPLGTIEVGTDRPAGWVGHASIRPEHLKPAAEEGTIPFGRHEIESMTFQGTHWCCRLKLGDDTRLSMRMPADRPFDRDGPAEIHLSPDRIVLLDR
ncbi:MAG: ABC transporter ATP-binding protein [Alphaproteobacteria bacterium]|nr:ABC transporter ATP-binding protein [Alphaproteobacteria bacterium]